MLYRDGTLVKGKQFDPWRRVGDPIAAMRVYQMRQVDELLFLDVDATEPKVDLVRRLSESCFVPLSVGGGVRTVEHFSTLLRAGADKVVINTAAVETPELITQAAERFGSQAVVVSIDYRDTVYIRSGTERTDLDPVEWAREAVERGAGEVILCSIERDGMMSGYDLETIRRVDVSVPVVASGGAGCGQDLCDAVDAGADACAVGALFHFTQMTPLELKRYMAERGYAMRIPKGAG